MQNYRRARLRPGVRVLPDELSHRYDMAVSSNNGPEVVNKTMKMLHINDYFKEVMSRDTANPKPNPNPLVKIIKKTKSKKVIMIGDFVGEVLVAKNARKLLRNVDIGTVALTSTIGKRTFGKVKPDFMIEDIVEPREYLG